MKVTDFDALRRLMPPPDDPGLSVDWDRMTKSWGTPFPADYRAFIDLYGTGTIENHLVVVRPEPKDAPSDSGMVNETATAHLNWPRGSKAPELAGAEPALITWGVNESPDLLCWDASGSDPDSWPVVVFAADDVQWRRYDCGMVGFLRRVFDAEFDESPLSATTLWGLGSAKFLTVAEQMRLLRAGLDPWTGKPDEFAGMYTYPEP